MKTKKRNWIGATLIWAFSSMLFVTSCKKSDLNLKPNDGLVLPQTASDYQRLLNNYSLTGSQSFLGIIGGDELYITDDFWNTLNTAEKNSYIWAEDVYSGTFVFDWYNEYNRVFYANVVLEGLEKLTDQQNSVDFKTAKGCALFFRAWAFWQLAQEFCPVYDPVSSGTDLGLPLRIHSDVLAKVPRSKNEETYAQIINDLKTASELLPVTPPSAATKTQPSKGAANALLGRVYLSMRNYELALKHSNLAIETNGTLLDYNTLSKTASSPFPAPWNNTEVILEGVQTNSRILSPSDNPLIIPNELYNSYELADLRKILFFTVNAGLPKSKAGYDLDNYKFTGLAADELYLIVAECYARLEKKEDALISLNRLLKNRYNSSNFVPITAGNSQEALSKILQERRKELIFRGLRWSDLRRLNKDGANITLTRLVGGKTYSLSPNSLRYTYPIPKEELDYNAIPQNPR